MTEAPDRRQCRDRLRNAIGLALLAGAFIWALVTVTVRTFGPHGESALTKDKKVIRFAHWQLEGGFVAAVNDAMREYEALHPDVVVEQIDVHERAYSQWVQTQLVGRTAPDLIELRFLSNLIVRYFTPVTELTNRPNPYNGREWVDRLWPLVKADEDRRREALRRQGKTAEEIADLIPPRPDAPPPEAYDLEGMPWRNTYIDGMLGGYFPELQDYYGIPMSVFTVRCYANKQILKAAAGVTEPPKTFGEFLRLCQAIQDYARANRLKLVPIAGSNYTESMFRGRYWDMAGWGLLDKQDVNDDGGVSAAERLLAFMGGKIDMVRDPYVEAGHRILFDISRYFNPGFMAANRDQSVFLFAQGNAAMIATGTWDAGSLWQQVEGDFDILIFDFPVPAPGEPYADLIPYRCSEAGTTAQGLMGLSKFSRHPEVALDFMHFLTSRLVNEQVNLKWRWFPAIRGAQTDRLLRAFEPRVEGVPQWITIMDMGVSNTKLRYEQARMSFISAVPQEGAPYEAWLDRHYRGFITGYWNDFRQYAFSDFETLWKDSYTAGVQSEVALLQARARAMRFGQTADIERNLLALVMGQTIRMANRAFDWHLYEEAREAYAAREAKGATP